MRLTAISYYLRSIPTLLAGIRNWEIVARLLAGNPGRPLELRLRGGCRFRVRSLMDLWIIKETCLDRDYEWDLPPLIEDWRIVDIGAGLGDFSIHAAFGHPQRAVAAFEPFAESFNLLQENLVLNGVRNVQAFPLAVGARCGPMQLETATGIAVQHSTARAGDTGPVETLRVEGITLAEALRVAGFDRCDLLKVDCEGGEYDIFQTATADTFARIDRIVMEYHDGCTPHTHAELVDVLGKHGFAVRLRENPVHRRLGFLTAVRRR
ncbi:MAG: FkbM family methyltransferase [Anaerolineales bacterium]|jgi:FkbM family methyltransferase